MGIKATTLVPVVGVGAFVAGLLLGLWAGGGDPLSVGDQRIAGSASPRTGGRGADGPAGGGTVASGEGGGRDPDRSAGAPERGAAVPLSPSGSGSAAASSSSSGAGVAGAVPRGTSTGRPASTSVAGAPVDPPPVTGGSPPSRPVPARTGALPPYVLPAKITGRIADALNGGTPPGAEVALRWQLSDGTISSAIRAEVQPDGTFVLEPREPMRSVVERGMVEGGYFQGRFPTVEEGLADMEYALSGTAKGYATVVKGDPAPTTDLSLVPEGLDRLPGTVRVDALRGDGSRFPGRMLVDFLSGDRGSFSQWALPEPDGTFLFAGVPPGAWSVRASGKSDSGRDVVVPESGEVRVEVLVPRVGLAEAVGAPAGAPREVVVAVPDRNLPGGAFLRAEARPGLFFRVDLVGGRAGFASLPAGSWTFVIQAPGRAEERFSTTVRAGEGCLDVAFPPEGG